MERMDETWTRLVVNDAPHMVRDLQVAYGAGEIVIAFAVDENAADGVIASVVPDGAGCLVCSFVMPGGRGEITRLIADFRVNYPLLDGFPCEMSMLLHEQIMGEDTDG